MQTRCLNCMREYNSSDPICPYCGFVAGTPPKEIYHLHPGITLQNRYQIGTVVSFGGFGVIYRAWDSQLDTIVAIKEFFPATIVTRIPGDAKVIPLGKGEKLEIYNRSKALFIEEARNTAKFSNHPNITNVYNYFEENNTAYMVMEFLEGITLKGYLDQCGGKIDIETTINILLSIISALKEVHKAGFLHRDISPDNIFICTNNVIKLIDFGAAKFSDEENEQYREVVLKPGYAPPEQYEKKSKQAPWTDIYALGATMYRAITGMVPVESTNRLVEDTLERPKSIVPNIPDYIDAALIRAMSLTPQFRFRNVTEFEQAILAKKVMRSEAEQKRFLLIRRIVSVSIVASIILVVGIHSHLEYKHRTTLSPCDITVWMPIEEKEEAASAFGIEHDNGDALSEAQDMMDNMLVEFNKDFPDVNVTVEYKEKADYHDELVSALQSGEGPTVFMSDGMTSDELRRTADLGDVIKFINKNSYYYLENYEDYFPEKNQIPLGFSMPVVFCNTGAMEDGIEPKDINDKEAFMDSSSTFYVGGSEEYREIQSVMPANCDVVPVLDGDITGTFISLWSVNEASGLNEKEAGIRLIYYFLGGNQQDYMFVQNDNGLPLNKNELAAYETVYPKMHFIEDYLDQITFRETGTSDQRQIHSDLYKEQFVDGSVSISQVQGWLRDDAQKNKEDSEDESKDDTEESGDSDTTEN